MLTSGSTVLGGNNRISELKQLLMLIKVILTNREGQDMPLQKPKENMATDYVGRFLTTGLSSQSPTTDSPREWSKEEENEANIQPSSSKSLEAM